MAFLGVGVAMGSFAARTRSDDVAKNSLDAVRAERLRTLAESWQQPSFSTRRAASQQIEAAGKEAYPVLVEVAMRGGPEAAQRALEILERALKRSDSDAKSAARQAVEQIASGSNRSASQAAQELLKQADRPPVALAGTLRAGGQVLRLFPGRPPVPLNGLPVPALPARPMPLNPPLPGLLPPALPIDRERIAALDRLIARTRQQLAETADPGQRQSLHERVQQYEDLKRRTQLQIMPAR
jgi:hypothetical protein